MAEQTTSTSQSKESGFKNFIIVLLTALLITGGLLATFTDYLKDIFKRNTKTYTCNLTLRSGPNRNLHGISVTVKGDKTTTTDNTDDNGNVIFELKKNLYKISFSSANKHYVRNFSIVSDTTIMIDIAASLTSFATGEIVKTPSLQPDKKMDQKKIVLPSNVVKITATAKNDFDSLKSVAPPAIANTGVNKVDEQSPVSVNEILDQLKLEVRIDKSDSYKNRGKQLAYHYYLSGKKEFLDQIRQVNYQRNHSTFDEFQNDRFNVSEDRSTNFEYVGYQWGSIPDTYVRIILKNGQRSEVFLKTITYR